MYYYNISKKTNIVCNLERLPITLGILPVTDSVSCNPLQNTIKKHIYETITNNNSKFVNFSISSGISPSNVSSKKFLY